MRDDVKFTHLKSGGKMTRATTLQLKNPKEDKTKHGVRIDIFETTGPLRWLCAVNAAMKYEGAGASSAPGTAASRPPCPRCAE